MHTLSVLKVQCHVMISETAGVCTGLSVHIEVHNVVVSPKQAYTCTEMHTNNIMIVANSRTNKAYYNNNIIIV